MDRQGFSQWLDRWVALWSKTNLERSEIEALFSEDATWSFQPYESEPARGRAAVVDRWLENIDPPGSWECHYEPLAVDGETAVAQGCRYEKERGAASDATGSDSLPSSSTASSSGSSPASSPRS